MMTPFKDLHPGIWEAKRLGRDGGYNILVKIYGTIGFLDIVLWDYNLSDKGVRTEITKTEIIAKYEFGNKIKELEG
jgi:hypothetical protein